jgi:hypothetical protein
MNELTKLVAAGELAKATDLMKEQLGLLERSLADADSRLSKIEREDELRRNFLEATIEALIVANLHQAPGRLQ